MGIELAPNLSWSPHIGKITRKGSQSLGFLKRNIHSAKRPTKEAAYNAIVQPTLEYCSSVWDPYPQKDIDKLENIQRQAARFVTNTYDKTPGVVTNALKELEWKTLQSRRTQSRLVLFHKMVHGHVDVNPSHFLTPYNRPSRHHHHLSYQIPTSSTDYFKFSFFPRTVILWNLLPSDVVRAESIQGFRSALATTDLSP